MALYPGSTIRIRLFFLVILAVVPLFGLTLYTAARERQYDIDHVQEEALKLAHESLNMNIEIGEKQRIIASKLLIATLLGEDNNHSKAETILREVFEESREMKDMEGMVAIGQALASNLVAQGKLDEAAYWLRKAGVMPAGSQLEPVKDRDTFRIVLPR